jgi:hypothetical protein
MLHGLVVVVLLHRLITHPLHVTYFTHHPMLLAVGGE